VPIHLVRRPIHRLTLDFLGTHRHPATTTLPGHQSPSLCHYEKVAGVTVLARTIVPVKLSNVLIDAPPLRQSWTPCSAPVRERALPKSTREVTYSFGARCRRSLRTLFAIVSESVRAIGLAMTFAGGDPEVDVPNRCRLGARSHPGPGFLPAEKLFGDDVANVDPLRIKRGTLADGVAFGDARSAWFATLQPFGATHSSRHTATASSPATRRGLQFAASGSCS
jgi:hypothetical protein